MIETHIIPEGLAEIPVEARDHGILWSYIQNVSGTNFSPNAVQRVVTRERLKLRLPGKLSDYTSTELGNLASAVTSNIAGVKQHPDGWHEVTTDAQ